MFRSPFLIITFEQINPLDFNVDFFVHNLRDLNRAGSWSRRIELPPPITPDPEALANAAMTRRPPAWWLPSVAAIFSYDGLRVDIDRLLHAAMQQ